MAGGILAERQFPWRLESFIPHFIAISELAVKLLPDPKKEEVMPCYDSRPDEDARDNRIKVDKLTRLLCEAGKTYKSGKRASDELLAWWEQHEKDDAIRLKKEAEHEENVRKRKTALGKLTLEEKRLLGLK